MEGMASLARERGLPADAEVRRADDEDGRWRSGAVYCYRAEGPAPWFRARLTASLGTEPIDYVVPLAKDRPPIRVGSERFEEYSQALSEIAWLLDEYLAGNVGQGEWITQVQKRRTGSRQGGRLCREPSATGSG